MDREYFDAKFSGLEKLMEYQQRNTDNHISAVSANVKQVARELREHQESIDPHGRRATDKMAQNFVAYLGLAVASVVAYFEIKRH